jgi:tol-pal system protein YbgF
MAKPYIYIAALLIIGSAGCAPTGRLNARVDLMEKEVADLHQMNRRILKRFDEMQMQLSLFKKKLVRPASGTQGVGPRVPELKVVKLHPGNKGFWVDRPRSKKVSVTSTSLVDPKNVSEKLPVDLRAARRPILGLDPDGEDDETIVSKFGHVCSFYNAADFKTAVSALNYFIELYPEHPLAIDALHLLGESKLAQGKVQEARATFDALTERHPESKRAISALFMVGKCEEKLGKVKQARSTYLQVVQAYPLSREAAEANRRLQAMR